MKALRFLLTLAAAWAVTGVAPLALAQTASLTTAEATARYHQGEALEHKRDLRAALDAYTEAAEAGNGHAQKKLGDFYSNGNTAVERNYETALKWYAKAREQGIEIPKPLNYPANPVSTIVR